MTSAASCTVTALHIGDLPFPLARHRRSGDGRCGDCGVEPGGYHHLGCDLVRCPRSGRQLITCGCPFDELGHGEGDEDVADEWAERDGLDGLDEEDDDCDCDCDCGCGCGCGCGRPGGGLGGEESSRGGMLPWEQVCPRCGSSAVIPILYGIRNPTSSALEAHGVLELGESSDPDRPTSRCKACEHGWTLGRTA